MQQNYLVFTIDDIEYAVSLMKVPIVLMAKKYIESSRIKDINIVKIPFEGAEIKLVDIACYLPTTVDQLTFNSKLLVGQLDDDFFGFIVDDVKEIIMIDESEVQFSESTQQEFLYRTINTGEQVLRIIDIDKIIDQFKESAKDDKERNE